MDNSKFKKGSGCFKCADCGKMTRNTGQDSDELCQACEEMWMEENQKSDDGLPSLNDGDVKVLSQRCPKCNDRMLDDGNGKYIYCRDADCNWCEFIKKNPVIDDEVGLIKAMNKIAGGK